MTLSKYSKPTLNDPNLFRESGYIDGKWVKGTDEVFEVVDPASGEIIARVPEQPVSVVEEAIDVAYETFKTYKNTTPRERAKWLRNMYNLMLENLDDLATIITLENGKALGEAKGEIKYAASYFEWYAEEAPRLYGATIQPLNPHNRRHDHKKGCRCFSCGLHSSHSQTPLSALAMAYLAEKAGFPKGSFNVILSHANTPKLGKTLCESPKVKKVTFTGSTNVGKILMKQSSSTLKKLSFELGGNAPFIVFEDADLDQALEQAMACKFRGLGQTCVCANRLYVHSSIIDKFAKLLAERVKKFVIGHGLDPKTTHGCVINSSAIEKVERHKQDAIDKGAKVVLEGGRLTELGPNFYAPVILSHVPSTAIVSKEETFGPLCPIFSFDTMEEVVGYANDTEFGLAAYVFSKNVNTLYTVSEALETGMVSCNTGVFSDCSIPFGGVKESGFGREGSLYGIEDYTVLKTITIGNLPNSI
ncbi:succinate-semialdehyde dehydrogenase NADP+ [Saccharomyces cerevisiae]|nr:succinate-semialdehyde dehydrogenase NADP+ [Saccharomyces cerevisiae]